MCILAYNKQSYFTANYEMTISLELVKIFNFMINVTKFFFYHQVYCTIITNKHQIYILFETFL